MGNIKDIVLWIEIITAILLIIIILLQPKTNAGMGSMAGEDSSTLTTKRGGERVIHKMTVFLAILFAVSAFLYHIV